MIPLGPEDQVQRPIRPTATMLPSFLALLEQDIVATPLALIPLTQDLATRIAAATEGVTIDPNDPIAGDVAL